jgi:hypothetical protein
MKKKIIGHHPAIFMDNNCITENMYDIVEETSPYFAVHRSHCPIYSPSPLERDGLLPNALYTYPRFRLALQKAGEINIKGIDVQDEIFYESRMEAFPGEDPEPAIHINVNRRFAGYYLPRINTILATDWTHCEDTVESFRAIWPQLIKKLNLAKLNADKKVKSKKIEFSQVTIGADPEFELIDPTRGNEVLYAEDHISDCWSSDDEDDDGSDLGVDGAGDQVELRPAAGDPRKVVKNIKKLFKKFSELYSQYDLSDQGDYYPLGGHIHVGIGTSWRPDSGLIQILDDFVGRAVIELSGEARESYKKLGQVRTQPHGFEYRTAPSAIFQNPAITYITLRLVQNLCEKYFQEHTLEYESRPTIQDYMQVGGLTKQQANYFVKFIAEYKPTKSITKSWHVADKVEVKPSLVNVIFSDKWSPYVRQWIKKYISEKVKVDLPIVIKLYGLGHQRGMNLCTIPTSRTTIVSDIPHAVWNASSRTLQVGLSYNRRTSDGFGPLFGASLVDGITRYIQENCR